MKTGVELIAEERVRQVEEEGWTNEHDDDHKGGALATAAACYAAEFPIYREERYTLNGNVRLPVIEMRSVWPWSGYCYNPKDRLFDLVRAGALIAAEIDRLQREKGGGEHE